MVGCVTFLVNLVSTEKSLLMVRQIIGILPPDNEKEVESCICLVSVFLGEKARTEHTVLFLSVDNKIFHSYFTGEKKENTGENKHVYLRQRALSI